MNRDALIGALGGLVLVGAMVATFVYEASYYERSLVTLQVSFSPKSIGAGTFTGTATSDAGAPMPVPLAYANMTEVLFVLSWSDETPPPGSTAELDRLNLTVRGPDGTNLTATAEDATGEIRLVVGTLNPLPNATERKGPDEAVLREGILDEFASTFGGGNWTVTVVDDDPGHPQVAGQDHPTARDTSNAWFLAVTVTVYEADVSKP